MADEEILPFLLRLRAPTLFTRYLGLDQRCFCHAGYCLVILDTGLSLWRLRAEEENRIPWPD